MVSGLVGLLAREPGAVVEGAGLVAVVVVDEEEEGGIDGDAAERGCASEEAA